MELAVEIKYAVLTNKEKEILAKAALARAKKKARKRKVYIQNYT